MKKKLKNYLPELGNRISNQINYLKQLLYFKKNYCKLNTKNSNIRNN